jgi:hypothetical protein
MILYSYTIFSIASSIVAISSILYRFAQAADRQFEKGNIYYGVSSIFGASGLAAAFNLVSASSALPPAFLVVSTVFAGLACYRDLRHRQRETAIVRYKAVVEEMKQRGLEPKKVARSERILEELKGKNTHKPTFDKDSDGPIP